jgi:hypothetical protein
MSLIIIMAGEKCDLCGKRPAGRYATLSCKCFAPLLIRAERGGSYLVCAKCGKEDGPFRSRLDKSPVRYILSKCCYAPFLMRIEKNRPCMVCYKCDSRRAGVDDVFG